MADHLLSILRGTAPAPAAPPTSRPPHDSSATPSLSRHGSATSPASDVGPANASNGSEGRASAAPNPLEQLLRTFSQPRPTNGSSPAPPAAAAASPSSSGPEPAKAAESSKEGRPAGAPGKDSAALLSLLRGSGTAAMSLSAPGQPLTSPLLSPRGGNAKDLLGFMMGSTSPTPAAGRPQAEPLPSVESSETSRPAQPEAQSGLPPVDMLGLLGMKEAGAPPETVETAAATTASSPAATAAAAPSAPVFTFVSPFDFLESTRSPPPPVTASGPDAAQNETGQPREPAELSPTQLPTPTDSVGSPGPRDHTGTARRDLAPLSPAGVLAAAVVAASAPSPGSVLSASEVTTSTQSGKAMTSAAEGGSGTFPREYLALAYIPAAPAPAPSWAPLGVRLPRRASLPYNAPQHLTISTSDPHREALVPSAPEVTPIALFSVPSEDSRSLARRRTAGIWEHGIAYASAGTGKHRIRVIDRESGAKVLLKGKKDEKEVIDLQVDHSSRDGQRRIACVSNGGALSVWQVPERFDNEVQASQQSSRLLHIAGSALPSPFVLARLVPGQQRLYAVRSDRVISVYCLSQPAAKPRDIRLIGGGEIVDVAFSPDATYAAVLMTQSVVTFQLENSGAQKKTALDEILPPGFEADQVAFVTPARDPTVTPADGQRRPLGLAVSSAHGARVSVFPIYSQDGRLSLASTPTVQIEVTPPSEHGDSLFGQMEYHEQTQSLVLSHSLRGSLFTFRLAFVEGPDGEPLIRVNHVLEHPTPEPVLSFTLDSLPAADPHSAAKGTNLVPEGVRAASKIRYGALVVHPGGVHHVAMISEQPRQYAEVAPKHRSHGSDTSSDGEGGGARRMSLEGSIHVSSEVEVTVEEIQVVELELGAEDDVVQSVLIAASVDEPEDVEHLSPAEGTPRVATTSMPAVSPPRRAVAEPAMGDLSNGLPAAATPIAELSSAEASPLPPGLADVKLSGPLVNAAIRNMKATRSGSPAAAASVPLGPAPTGGAQRNGPNDLARFEQALPAKIAQIVQQELRKTEAPSEELDAKLADLEQRLRTSLTRVLERQTGAVMTMIQKVLPIELSRHLTHPDLVLTLSEAVASNVAPMLEQSVASQIVSAVLPRLDRQLSGVVEGVIDSIRQEMLDVRKEIVQEQSGAVSILEDEVANLREEVSTMKAMLEKMERLLMASAAAAATTNATSPRIAHAPLQSTSSRQATVRHASQPASASQANHMFAPPQHAAAVSAAPATAILFSALPPIPRAATPPARYEELFTDVMLPSHEPEFVALAQLIMSSPLSRLEAIFPPAPAVPSLTMPVVLSLAYRLSQLIANKDGPVDDADKRHLLWLRKAIAACDGKQSPEIIALVPRILQNVVDNLVVRGRRLMAMNDQAGAGEVRLVTQYAHARLTLFLQAGAEGPGVETFRR